MHKIDKFLRKLDKERREKVLVVLLQIRSGDFQGLNLKKLKVSGLLYRVRVGRVRIIFEMDTNGIRLVDIDFRNDNTYKGY
jgi:mRNA-degrading endonuclease RelE of RelBE toxin-antitoxin system